MCTAQFSIYTHILHHLQEGEDLGKIKRKEESAIEAQVRKWKQWSLMEGGGRKDCFVFLSCARSLLPLKVSPVCIFTSYRWQ